MTKENQGIVNQSWSAVGISHAAGNRVSWEWAVLFDDENQSDVDKSLESDIEYENMESQCVVIVAASKGWMNYRHQADALHIYRILKDNGFPDDRIILIMEGDIARNPHNKKTGQVFVRNDCDNLYDNVQLDYKLSDITMRDLKNIILGNRIDAFPASDVLSTDSHANVLWFWTGHGRNRNGISNKGQFEWAGKNSAEGFTTKLMAEILNEMKTLGRFRKLLVMTEACYSASVMNAAENIDGALAITASNGLESSLGDECSIELCSWLSNRFTHNLTECILKAKGGSLYFWTCINISFSIP